MSTARAFAFDDSWWAEREGVHLQAVPVTKHGVVLEAEEPSDLEWVSCFAGSVVTLGDGRFRMYYSCVGGTPRAMRIAVAESADGFAWARPRLGQLPWEGRDTNHLAIDGVYEGANLVQPVVLHLPDGSWRMYCWLHGHDRGIMRYIISESDDGLRWRTIGLDRPAVYHPSDLEVGQAGWVAGLTAADPRDRFADRRTVPWAEAKRLRSNDATYVYYDPATDLFEMLSVWLLPNSEDTGRHTPHDNAPGVLRAIHRRVSTNGVDWGAPELVIVPDANDPLDQQFYYLAQHREEDWRIGFLGNYPCWEQTMDIELCFSRDGRRWQRPLRGAFIPRDPPPERGCMSAYATNDVISAGGECLLLYTGGNRLHNGKLPPGVEERWCGVMAATWPKGRFAGLATATGSRGSLTMKPFIPGAAAVSVDADIAGRLRAELRDVFGRPLPGYELHESVPVRGDSPGHVLAWGEESRTTAPYRYDAVSLRLELDDGAVYAVDVGSG